jgi:hypothetical protein
LAIEAVGDRAGWRVTVQIPFTPDIDADPDKH